MSENKKITNISDYLASLTPDHREMVEELRSLVRKTVLRVEEKMAWSMPQFSLDGKMLVALMNAKGHVSVVFGMGVHLHSELLEGTGKNLRHVKITDMENLKKKEKELSKLLQESEKIVV